MSTGVLEVKSAVVKTFEGEAVEVSGGAYYPPEAVLQTNTELERLRLKSSQLDTLPNVLPGLVLGAGLFGFAIGLWLARRTNE